MGIDFFGAKLFMMDPRLSVELVLAEKNPSHHIMGDLLEYFEAQSRNLDEMSASWSSAIPTNFTSVIKFNGVPILPPVMTAKRREEMLTYRRQAMRLENRRKSKQREKLVARVQSIVAEVEKEFALKRRSRLPRTARISQLIEKQNSRLSDSVDSSPVSSGTDVSSKWSPESVNSSRSPAGISKTNSLSSNNRSKSMTNINNEKTVKVEKSKPSNTKKIDQSQEEKSVNKSDKFVREQRTKIPAPVHTTKSTPQKAKPKASSKSQAKALSNLKKSSSMSSLPNPAKIPGTPSYPVPKPPSTKMTELQARRSNLLITGRISFSNPDLRDFDDDNSLSCKSESGISRNTRRMKKSAWQQANQHSASDPDISRNEIGESQGFVLSPEEPILQSPKIHRLKKQHKTAGSNPELSSTQYSPEVDPEKFRQEFLASKKKKQQKSTAANTERKTSPSENKSQTKETSKRRQLPVEPKVEEPQSLNDYPSLDDCNSLPQEFSGLPLTSVKQQQIGQVLAKLSKHLNLQDTGETLNSTSSSSSTENNMKQSVYSKSPSKNKEEEKKQKYFHSPTLSDNSGNSGKDGVEASVSSFNQSGVNSSVISSVGSVGTNQSRRMSPKGLKNTVHFSSFVTEISTSASQSVEDKISVRKMDITPSNSVDLTGRTGSANSSDLSNQGQNGKPMPKNVNDLGSSAVPQVSTSTTQPYRNNLFPGQPGSMLSKVALSPEESPGGTPKSFFKDQEVPFHVYTAEIEHNTSDKENENVYQKQIPADMDDKLNLLERELNKSCDQTYGNIFMLTGKRSNDSDDRSQGSTLKESQENVISGIQRNYFKNDIYSDANRTDFEKVMKVSSSVIGSSGHVMGDVNQSKHLTHGTSSVNNIIPPTGSQISPNIVPKSLDRHVRHGSYTLEHPSDALLKAKLNQQSPQYSSTNGNITKMNIGPESIEPVSISQNDMSVPTSESSEQNAKAEHIQRYLSQVQPHPVEDVLENNQQPIQSSHTSRRPYDIGEAVQSFTETLQSFETLTEDEMLKIQADHFNKIRQHLIEQQKTQLEELFVSQRREQMNLQEEIEMHHDHLREQQELFTSFSEQNNLSQFSANNLQNTSVNSYNDSAQNFMNPSRSNPSNPNFSVNNQFQMIAGNHGNSFMSAGSQQTNMKESAANMYVPNSYIPTNSTNNYVPQSSANGYVPTTSGNRYLPNESVLSEIPGNVSQPVYSQQMPANYPTQQKPFSYISSPSLYFNPRDRDNESDISTFSRGTPKQSLKFNHSTPSPKAYKPVLHSPVKEVQNAWTSSTMVYPESAFDPRLQHCFDRVSACVKGYLTRRLLVTEKVQEVVKTISDTKCFARSFQAETPIKKGQVNNQDRDLLDRIIAQLQAALLDVHEIFFDIPVWERMQIIDHDRQVRDERRLRESGATTRSSVSSSQPRISSATLKAMERKRKAQEAESAVFGDIRPRSAPHVDERCHRESTDLSGPLRRHFQFLLSRALQPSHLSHSHNTSSQSGSTTARTRTRPKTAPSQPVQHQHPVHQTSNPSTQQTTAATAAPKTRKTASTAKSSTTSTASVAPKRKKSGKAWR